MCTSKPTRNCLTIQE